MIYLSRKMIPRYLQEMAMAIMNFEGYQEGSRSYRNNNPGNLRWFSGPPYPWEGCIGVDDEQHAIFDTFEHGWNALIKQLKLAFENKSKYYYSSMTFYDFFRVYAEANPIQYAEYVAGYLKVDPYTKLENLSKVYKG